MKIKPLIFKNIYFFIPIIFGFWSMMLGQDRNEDLAGYHLYNGFSFLFNKFEIDYGVAGLRTYFNPLLDAFFFYLNTHLIPPLFGFLMGILHGLIFFFILDIAQIFLKKYQSPKNSRLILFVSICCVLTPNFISGLGNSMGDNTTALLNVISIWLVIKYWNFFKKIDYKASLILAIAGLFIGISAGFKLTNSIYAIALCTSLLLYPTSCKAKLSLSIIFGLFVIFGISAASGFWFLKLWAHFHNPIFPFFNNIFHNPHSSISVIDPRWGPNNIIEAILWPFIFSFDYHRAGEGLVHQFIWPFFYILLIVGLINKFIALKFIKIYKKLNARDIFLIGFISIAFILWMFLFSLQRYLVTVELFIPLATLILLIHFFSFELGSRIFIKLYILSLTFIFLGGFGTWGHSTWTNPPFRAEVPRVINLDDSTVLLTNQGANLSWLVTQFPKNLSFVRLGVLNKYEVKKYVYVMFASAQNWRVGNVKKWESILRSAGFLNSFSECVLVDQLIKKIKYRGKLVWDDSLSMSACHLEISDSDYVDIEAANNVIIYKNQLELSKYKFSLDRLSCKNYQASIGGQGWSYIFCSVNKSN